MRILANAMLILIPFLANASDTLNLMYFTNTAPLSQSERKTLNNSTANQKNQIVKPFIGPDGSITYTYGAGKVDVICAVFVVCDVQLQRGEEPTALRLGDTVRWDIGRAVSGSGPNRTVHIQIKPKDSGLTTNLNIYTNKRAYYIRLKSHQTKFMDRVRFNYPNEQLRRINELAALHQIVETEKVKKEEEVVAQQTIPETLEYIGDLDFDYSIRGQASFKPVRVYNNGVKTVIQLPSAVRNENAPVLLVVNQNTNQDEMVNYRLQNNKYVVDAVFQHAILISGVGKYQKKIHIVRSSHEGMSYDEI